MKEALGRLISTMFHAQVDQDLLFSLFEELAEYFT